MRPTPCPRAAASSSVGLVVAVQHETLGRHARREGDVQLASRRHVEVHALLEGHACHGPAQEGLGRIGHALAPRVDGLTAGAAQVLLVVDEQRRSELLRQLEQVDPADVQVALLIEPRRAREELPLQWCGRYIVIGGGHGGAGYGSVRVTRGGRVPAWRRPSTIVVCSCARTSDHPPP